MAAQGAQHDVGVVLRGRDADGLRLRRRPAAWHCARRRSARRRPATCTLPVTFAVHGRSHATATATAKVVRKRCGVRAVAVSASRSLRSCAGSPHDGAPGAPRRWMRLLSTSATYRRPAAVDREVERMRELAGAAAHAVADPRGEGPGGEALHAREAPVGDVERAVGRGGERARGLELAVAAALRSEAAQEGAVGRVALDAALLLVGDEQRAVGGDRHPLRRRDLVGPGAQGKALADRRGELPVRREPLDAAVAAVGHVDVARAVDGHAAWDRRAGPGRCRGRRSRARRRPVGVHTETRERVLPASTT